MENQKNSDNTIKTPLVYKFTPKEDITAYELALVLEAFLKPNFYTSEDDIPEPIRRHIEIL